MSRQAETILTPEKANAVYVAGFGFPMRDDDPDYPALSLGGYMLGGGFLNSRLATRIRQKEGISYGVRGGFGASALDKNASFNASMIYNPQNVERLDTAFREEIERAARDGFTSEELEAARSGWLKAREVSRANDGALAGMLAEYIYIGRDFTFDAAREEAVKKLTAEQVNAVVKKYLDYSRMISVKAGDFNSRQAVARARKFQATGTKGQINQRQKAKDQASREQPPRAAFGKPSSSSSTS